MKAFHSIQRRAMLGVSIMAILPAAAFAQSLPEQSSDSEKDINDIVVTGTLLRGVAPAGSETVSLSRENIIAVGANSTAQLLASVPQTASFNANPIVSANGSSQVTINRPNLRNLPGASGGGSSTLILVDGHRLPGMGVRQTVPDPDAIAPGAIERVEIVLDGGSSIYGADAVGGVINFITRKRFDGVEARARYGFGNNYQSTNASVTVGKAGENASIYLSYDFAWHDSLYGRDRDYVQRLDYANGLPFDLNCGAGNASIGSAIYALPGLTRGSGNRCDLSDGKTFYPSERRHSVFAGFSYDAGGSVTFDMRAFYMNRVNKGNGGPITASATIAPINPFAPGLVFNPYYRNTNDANSFQAQSVAMDFSSILGTRTSQSTRLETWGFTPSMTADLGDKWQLRWFGNYGRGTSRVANQKIDDGTLSNLVLTGNFDPYNLRNPANSADLALVSNFLDYGVGKNELVNSRLVVDGSLFTLPGGDVKVAVGGEYSYEKYQSAISGTIAASAIATVPQTSNARRVAALFGEMQVPVVGEGNRMGGIYALNLSASGRYDHYSDFGGTFNPKFGLTYQPVEGVKIRGTWGKSFQAPSLADGADAAPPTLFAFPFILFANPAVAPAPGQAQIFLGGGGVNLKPQKATTWSAGFDISPPSLPGFALSVNYYNIKFTDLIDIPPVFNPSVFYALFPGNYIMNPTPAQVNALAAQVPNGIAQVSPYTVTPGQVYSIGDGRRTNLAGVDTDGIDFSLSYDMPTGFGSLYTQINGSYVLNREEQAAAGAPVVDTVRAQTRVLISGTLGAVLGNLRAQATLRHLGGWNVAPLASNLNQSRIKSYNIINMFAQYDFGGEGLFKDFALTLNVDNVFDEDPPAYNGSLNSLDGYAVSSIGRTVQIGISKKF